MYFVAEKGEGYACEHQKERKPPKDSMVDRHHHCPSNLGVLGIFFSGRGSSTLTVKKHHDRNRHQSCPYFIALAWARMKRTCMLPSILRHLGWSDNTGL
jgi:hypothetical protein